MEETNLASFSASIPYKRCGNEEYCRDGQFFSPETVFIFLKNKDHTKPGRSLCKSCAERVRARSTILKTKLRETAMAPEPNNRIIAPEVNDAIITTGGSKRRVTSDEAHSYRLNVEAQRSSQPNGHVQPLGFFSAMGPPPALPPSNTSIPGLASRGAIYGRGQGPNVAVAGHNPLVLASPGFLNPSKGQSLGYNSNHAHYENSRAKMRHEALSVHQGMVGRMRVVMVSTNETTAKFSIIKGVFGVISEVPIHTTIDNIRVIAHEEISEKFKEALDLEGLPEYPFRINDFKLCDTDGGEFNVSTQWTNHWYGPSTGKGVNLAGKNQLKLHKKPVEVKLVVTRKWQTDFNKWREDTKVGVMMESQSSNTANNNSEVKGKRKSQPRKRKLSTNSDDSDSLIDPNQIPMRQTRSSTWRQTSVKDSEPTNVSISDLSISIPTPSSSSRAITPPPTKKPRVLPPSPNTTDIRDALFRQNFRSLGGKQLAEIRVFQLIAHGIRKMSLDEFIQVDDPVSISLTGEEYSVEAGYYLKPRIIQVTTRLRDPQKGVFKLAYPAICNLPLSGSGGPGEYPVYVKQVYHLKEGRLEPLPNANQLKELAMEGRTMAFGHALLGLVDDYIDKELIKKGIMSREDAPISIPQFRYVDSALSMSERTTNELGTVFLVEQTIPGKFRKYMGNGNAKRPTHTAPVDNERVEFLMFAQHVQYIKTGKLAFAADFQGDEQWLTDPQIITHPEFGSIFTRGNIVNTFINFESDHDCDNLFCDFFKPSNDWPNVMGAFAPLSQSSNPPPGPTE
ncbi:hypothetical protein C8J56DRAFT_971999 [Mycena floridula]|nr:hypothetical protein C8J56DRAFT_971999 [Mycena floridula]